MTLLLEYGSFSALFTGDLEGAGEQELLQALGSADDETGAVDITLLKAAHHGSSGATGEAFLQLVHPQLAVISCGRNNSYGHPHAELLERLQQHAIPYLRTDESGEITVRSNGRTASVSAFVIP